MLFVSRIIPPTAQTDSWKPTLNKFSGLNKRIIITDNDKDSDTLITEIKDYWDESNFVPLNDEFNDFREFQSGLMLPYNFGNQRVFHSTTRTLAQISLL